MALAATHFDLQPLLQTYDDLRELPDDGARYELIFGEVVMSPVPNIKHQFVLGELYEAIKRHAREHQLGSVLLSPTDVKFSAHNVVQPDLLYLKRDRLRILKVDFVDGAPDLVVEILSPSNRAQDLVKKAALYATYAVPEYWIVDPESERISVNVLQDGQYVTVPNSRGFARSTVLPGLKIRIKDIFAIPEWMTVSSSDDSDDEAE